MSKNVKISLDLDKTLEENAAKYFEKAKKARSKIEGAENALVRLRKQLEEETAGFEEAERKASLKEPEKHWYSKYRWSLTRNGLLLVGGQNAAGNEVLVKKHGSEASWIFHTDMAGSPFVLLFGNAEEEDLEDGAHFTACYSKAWGKKMASLEVFHVKPEQVTKEAQSGEFLPKGAFMIRGETKYHHPQLALGIGVREKEGYLPEVFVGSEESCKKNAEKFKILVPGDKKTSDIAKILRKQFGGDLDAFVKATPTGGSNIKQ